MSTKIFYKPEVLFFIDENKKTVVCKLNFPHGLKEGFARKFWNPYMNTNIPSAIYGKAKCSENDKFDALIGKKIAYKRARLKEYSCLNKRLKETLKYYNDSADSCRNLLCKFSRYSMEVEEELKDITN